MLAIAGPAVADPRWTFPVAVALMVLLDAMFRALLAEVAPLFGRHAAVSWSGRTLVLGLAGHGVLVVLLAGIVAISGVGDLPGAATLGAVVGLVAGVPIAVFLGVEARVPWPVAALHGTQWTLKLLVGAYAVADGVFQALA
ncbi:hypothetical protein F5X71_13565 [Nocardia brasiliensis]|uniref:DUF1761 family protein n=1 Tax=Nocardia brasiliensis TaxID=37326 RepID=A0A6G9XQH1_NOCBR|nr:hypothetical protein [Nocardia brasiliensis]QIS03201.1 hypothetical protein F5X71_13565 [Nocardia brasiliensis]